MSTNRNWTMKLQDVLRERILEETKSETPRTDNFIQTMPELVLNQNAFVDHAALVRTVEAVRDHMIGWAQFARELERELMNSTPREWKP